MKLHTNELRQLCGVHSVVGDTLGVIEVLRERLSEKKIPSTITPYGVLVFGNTKQPKQMLTAHVDEVGFQVIKQDEKGRWLVRNAGHVTPVMLNNSNVYVQTAEGKVFGSFFANKELGENDPKHFSELFLETVNNEAICAGDYGSYDRVFYQSSNKIIATGLDNKISVHMILELVVEHPEILDTTLVAFVTEEESTYDCIAGLAHTYKPEYAVVVDMIPTHQVSSTKVDVVPENGKGPAIPYAFHDYNLHPMIREKLQSISLSFQKVFLDIPFRPEPQVVQVNGVTKGVNVLVPMYGWHNGSYSMQIVDYLETKAFVNELVTLLANT